MSLIPDMEMILPQTSGGGNVPAFLAKLWKMLNNPDIGKEVKIVKTYLQSLTSPPDLLVRRRILLPDQEPVPVLQLHAPLLLQTLQHGLLCTPAEHVRLS